MVVLDFKGNLEPGKNSPGSLPSLFECAAHLELLDAIVCMVDEVAAWGREKGFEEGVAWSMYCSNAALRFLIWSQTTEAIEEGIPPLDVLMVWHTYMLNTAAYHEYEMSALKGRLGHKGIDWAAVASHSFFSR